MERKTIYRLIIGLLCVLLVLGLALELLLLRAQAAPGTPFLSRELAGRALLHQAPLAALLLGLCAAAPFFGIVGGETEKAAEAMERPAPMTEEGKKTLRRVRLALLLLALLLIAAGAFNGSMRDVYVKAARICTECIGLG